LYEFGVIDIFPSKRIKVTDVKFVTISKILSKIGGFKAALLSLIGIFGAI
jgi:hypothetical protein